MSLFLRQPNFDVLNRNLQNHYDEIEMIALLMHALHVSRHDGVFYVV